ncbi:MAG: GNAT family N-acetyltransferase [Sphingomicrobium sp.]
MSAATRAARETDLPTIDRLFRSGFVETFGHLYSAEDLDLFLGQFTPEAWRAEFAGPGYAFRIGEQDGEPMGFAKLGPVKLPVELLGGAVELYQLYVLGPAHGSGLGAQLMDWVIATARKRSAGEVFLSVFTENYRAQAFYRRYGLEIIGPYRFMVGNQADEDVIMRLAL